MAEAILFSLSAGLLLQLNSRVLQEIAWWWGVNDELEKLRRTISTVQAVLRDAGEKSSKNNEVKVWLGHLKEVFYEADDFLDGFSTDALHIKLLPGNKISKKVRTFFTPSSNQLVYGVRMAHKVRDIRKRMNEIAENRKFHLDERSLESSVVNMDRETHSSPPAIVVGREDDKKEIMDYLLSFDCEDGVGVISIVGIGGLGKTTLAQSVFNDEKVKEYFELRLWVCVSDNFDLNVVIGKILGQKKSKNMEMNTLKDLLHKEINGKRYLLVLDDVWSDDQEKWSRLIDLLLGGSRGSRIIVTTRGEKVGRMARPIFLHHMQGLSEKESWLLLKEMAFLKGQVRSDIHEKIGKEIVTKCCGVPLAIRAVGSLLFYKESAAEWQAFKDKEIMKIDQLENSVLPILEISYNHLPSHLKNCFVYCRLFPKDSIIDVPQLINYWIAQGFVKVSDATQCPMDVGFEYFMELSWRSFFQEVEKDDWGNVSFCKMHDLIHDLATKLAGVEKVMVDSVGDHADGRTLHASFLVHSGSPWKVPASLLKASNLRTLILLYKIEFLPWHKMEETQYKMEETQWDVIISNFRRLRILDVRDTDITKVPRSISKLKHLRHLDLSNNKSMEALPDSITELHNLLTLTLDGCHQLQKLPRDTKKLVNLTQLSLEECDRLECMPPGMGQLTCLHKLSRFVVAANGFSTKDAGMLKELGRLNNLRGELEIINLGSERKATEFQEANLKEKQHIQRLELDWGSDLDRGRDNFFGDFEGMALEALQALQPHLNLKVFTLALYRGSKIPMWLSSLVNLVELSLRECVNCRHLPPMHQLCNLKRLYISVLESLEYIDNEPTTESAIGGRGESTSMTLASSFFPSLETLDLIFCKNLKGWWRTTPTPSPRFPCLSQLKILGCPNMNMTSMPLFPPLKAFTFGNGSVMSVKEILSTSTALVEGSSSSSSPPSSFSLGVSQLQILNIREVEDLESLPEDLTQNLPSLKTLYIKECHILKTLGQALRHLTSLEQLDIGPCEDLNLFDEAMHWQALRSLRSFYIFYIPSLEFFPSWFQHAMPSLHVLYIWSCPNLKCLPEWMGQLPSLQNLIIGNCPQLSERCDRYNGVDWPNIKSIPNIKINDRVIQRNGRYVLS